MMKLIELKKCLRNTILKAFSYQEPDYEINPNKYINRIRLEYSIFDMKINLYQKCFSDLSNVFHVDKISCFDGLKRIPNSIDLINLNPSEYLFIDDIEIAKFKFEKNNAPNRILSTHHMGSHDRVYSINNFKFSNEFIPLVNQINFEIHKLFVKDNLKNLDLRPLVNSWTGDNLKYYICMGCNGVKHIKNMNQNDYLVCSIYCGMKIRGLSYSDFI